MWVSVDRNALKTMEVGGIKEGGPNLFVCWKSDCV